MSYSTNLLAPLARRHAAELVRYRGVSQSEAARRVGVHPSTVSRWVKRAERVGGRKLLTTRSSRPHMPKPAVDWELETQIIQLRERTRHCAPVLRNLLAREGVEVSAATVGRVLRQHGMVRPRSAQQTTATGPWLRRAKQPGTLQMDLVRLGQPAGWVIVTLVDEASRFAFAQAFRRGGPVNMIRALEAAQAALPFPVRSVRLDHGRDFDARFAAGARKRRIAIRRSKPGRPNSNAIVERFNRTLRDEGLSPWRRTGSTVEASLAQYLDYYNCRRPHLALECRTPAEQLEHLRNSASPQRRKRR